MKTTKELIIEDITAKVEAKLASQKVELTLISDFEKSVKELIELNNKLDSDQKKYMVNFANVGAEKKALKATWYKAFSYYRDVVAPNSRKIGEEIKALGVPEDRMSKYFQADQLASKIRNDLKTRDEGFNYALK
jgi:hydroxypyruvate isomerase